MNIYLKPPDVASPSLMRVTDALIQYKPSWVKIVSNEDAADIIVLHVIGRQKQVTKRAYEINCKDKAYAVIQYAIRSTLSPKTEGWMPLWRHAKVVWSYYDLLQLVAEDGITDAAAHFDFYHSPLGVNSEVFNPEWDQPNERKIPIMTSGQSYLTESVKECFTAAKACFPDVNPTAIHLGKDLGRKNFYYLYDISDSELALFYSQVMYVSGLRRIEGFELPAAEGLLCGARPIMFDRPHYRKWFNDWAIFIPESTREETIEHLKNIFTSEYKPVTQEEIAAAKELFDWEKICTKFWERLFS